MNDVLISMRPKWCDLIKIGKKKIEVRKTRPKIKTPFKCLIYMTATKERCEFWEYITAYQNSKGDILNGSQKVIGEFVCDRIYKFESEFWDDDTYEEIKLFYESDDPEDEPEYCYETVGRSGEFYRDFDLGENTCLTWGELRKYIGQGIKTFYGWHISDLKIYDRPKKLREFRKPCPYGDLPCWNCPICDIDEHDNLIQCFNTVNRPPQSWCYVEALK